MIIGTRKEIRTDEYRVGLLPVGAELLGRDGHTVLVEKKDGLGSGFGDWQYSAAGAEIVQTADEIYACAEMIVKVKEPSAERPARRYAMPRCLTCGSWPRSESTPSPRLTKGTPPQLISGIIASSTTPSPPFIPICLSRSWTAC